MSAFQARHSSAVLPLEPTTSPADFAAARELFEILDKETCLAKISQSCYVTCTEIILKVNLVNLLPKHDWSKDAETWIDSFWLSSIALHFWRWK